MAAPYPNLFRWDGEAMVPLHPRRCDRHYVVGQVYPLIEHEERSQATHSHQFAWLHEAWMQLPEALADQFPTAEHLRKRALIEAGYYNETIVDAGNNTAALRVASAFRARDDFALVIVRGPVVVIRDAKSQSRRHMNKNDFQASKTAIMEIIAAMIGVRASQLDQNASRAA